MKLPATIHFVKRPHPATFVENRPPIGKLLYECALEISVAEVISPRAVVAYHKNKLVAILKYRTYRNTLHACGTLVDRRFRQKKLGTRLWESVIKKHRPKIIEVPVSTNAGMKFIKKMRLAHPEIQFVIHDFVS